MFAGLPIFAFWPFTSPLMLFWGMAAAAPIIIHLWNRRRYREVTWAAMEYLLAAVRENSRRIRVEQLLLLLIRTAILLLLAIALGDPAFSHLMNLGGGLHGQHTHWVLVFDGSYSMDRRREGKSRFEHAKELAGQLIDDSRQGDGFTLVLMGEPPQVVISEPAFDAEDVRNELELLRLRHGGGDLVATLSEVGSIVKKASELHPRLADTRVCFFSDLGRTTWEAADTPRGRSLTSELAKSAELELIDLGGAGEANAAITRLASREQLVTPAKGAVFDVELKRFGGGGSRRLVQLFVDGKKSGQELVRMDPAELAVVSFTHHFANVGEHTVEARLADDPLPLDNRRWLSMPVRPSVRALCVEGKQDAAKYVALALAPVSGSDALVSVDVAQETALLERDLKDFDCVFLCNVGRLGKDEAAGLRRYLKNRGALVFFLGDQVQADNYNEMLGREDNRLLPAKLGETKQGDQYFFDPRDYQHPLIEPFRGHTQTGLLTTPIWKYFRLSPNTEQGAKVALYLDVGDPAIVEAPVLGGRVVLCTTAASPASIDNSTDPPTPWTALSTWPSFPPLIQEMLRLAVSDQYRFRNRLVGESLSGSTRSAGATLPLTLSIPAEENQPPRSEQLPLENDGEDSRWSFDDTHWSGVYEARYGAPLSTTELYVANIDTTESDLARVNTDDLPSQFQRDYSADSPNQGELPSSKSSPYFRIVLAALFGLLLTETFLAWHFGKSA